MNKGLLTAALLLLLAPTAQGQSFSSGSTGADGPLDLTSGNRTVQLPDSGVLNYTTVNIPSGRTLMFKRNARNTPVYMLAQGNITIAGTIIVTAGSDPDTPPSHNTPGPGGFYGGQPDADGFGPGGGTLQQRASWVGPLSLVPIIGGSGGRGACTAFNGCHQGGGGGGAITIASSTSVTVLAAGTIYADGQGDPSNYGGAGAGGAIRLVANSPNISGNLEAIGGHLQNNNIGGPGVIRLEAPAGFLSFTGSSNPAAVLSSINPSIVGSGLPALTIVSIGGFAVPSNAGQRFDTVDLLLPNQLADPLTVVVQATNIPVGTQVTIGFINGAGTSTPSALQGTLASSSASPTISGMNRSAVTYLLAYAQFNPPMTAQKFNPQNTDHVDKIRVEAFVGAKPKYVFLRKDGTPINPEKLPQQFLQAFGM